MTSYQDMLDAGMLRPPDPRLQEVKAQLADRLNQTPAAHMQATENILRAVESQLFSDEALTVEGQLLWALVHAVAALAYELGVPAAATPARTPPSASPLPTPPGTAG